ncbi:Breast carcinoma amplified sequence [Rhizoctonia solani]|uniref:Breast carcinoma amplified sequence n=1 Tax=Rhizoctonia solani TaxID=456999 RepID=A0A8H8P840_9AGAM|nr:Breast carcinoma amplified sequence [Rhizoctonia solani]QRW27316.1 Breast carcinoma amplified sequence [Rhizoctonia solani]
MSDILLDSLPYYDHDLEEPTGTLKQLVNAEITKELQSVQHVGDDPRLPPLIQLFTVQKPMLAAELERVERGEPLPPLDMTRHQLPAPADQANATEEEWQKSLQNAKAHWSTNAAVNLSLLQTYGANSWKVHNFLLEEDAKRVEKALEVTKEQSTEVNRARKNAQLTAGAQLTALENKWTELISRNLQISMANLALEAI